VHELAVTKSILKLVLDHAAQHGGREVLRIRLAVGEMRNLEEDWIQRYFDRISRGTPAEHAVIQVRKVPVAFLCKACGKQFTANLREDKKLVCAHCASFSYDLVSGRELTVETVEIR
jgi:hydrogenase nickel incorporation protein HypA/HybF